MLQHAIVPGTARVNNYITLSLSTLHQRILWWNSVQYVALWHSPAQPTALPQGSSTGQDSSRNRITITRGKLSATVTLNNDVLSQTEWLRNSSTNWEVMTRDNITRHYSVNWHLTLLWWRRLHHRGSSESNFDHSITISATWHVPVTLFSRLLSRHLKRPLKLPQNNWHMLKVLHQ